MSLPTKFLVKQKYHRLQLHISHFPQFSPNGLRSPPLSRQELQNPENQNIPEEEQKQRQDGGRVIICPFTSHTSCFLLQWKKVSAEPQHVKKKQNTRQLLTGCERFTSHQKYAYKLSSQNHILHKIPMLTYPPSYLDSDRKPNC